MPDHVVTGNFLGFEQVDRMGLPFGEHRHQYVDRRDFLLAAGLHVGNGAMQRPLKPERRLRLGGFAVIAVHPRRRLVDEIGQFLTEPLQICAAGPQDPDDLRRIQQGQQQVFDGDELVQVVPGAPVRLAQAEFEFAGKHQSSSRVQSNGCWLRFDNAVT